MVDVLDRCRSVTSTILECVLDKLPQAGRILIARITGTVRRHAGSRELDSDEEAKEVAALAELAARRADLPAEVSGILEGFLEGDVDESFARQAAGLCRKAGADPEAIPAWATEGWRRREAARRPPFPGGLQAGPRPRP